MTWKPTPPEIVVTARKLADDGGWVDVPMQDLVPGDVYRAVAADGELIHPISWEPDDRAVSKVVGHPIKNVNNEIGSMFGEQGYGVPIEVYPSMEDLRKKGLS